MALINKLKAIGDAIREKTGTEDLLTLDEMATAISGITGGGDEIPEEALIYTGNCNYAFYQGKYDWLLKKYGRRITTKDITYAQSMFWYAGLNVGELPFDINFVNGGGETKSMFKSAKFTKIPSIDFKQTSKYYSMHEVFQDANYATEIGTLKNLYPSETSGMFQSCNRLRYLPEIVNLNLDRVKTYNYSNNSSWFNNCFSLRSIPESLLKQLCTPVTTSNSYVIFNNMFNCCYTLDEVKGMNPQTGVITSNMFTNTFAQCFRLKDIMFSNNEDGSPYVCNWKSQTIDLTKYLGYASSASNVTSYNSGITVEKEVTNADAYQALKDNPDWFTTKLEYSRYNHDSAVNTINSLPDTSAYVLSSGGTNTIKFKGDSGSATDGGAINTLTEEEISVAAAKGWTVSFA